MVTINGIGTLREMFEKLEREYMRLDEEVTKDDFFNFAVTAHHLIDWAFPAKTLTDPGKAERNAICSMPELKACRDVANQFKHKIITRYAPSIGETSVVFGYGPGRFGRGGWGVGEAEIKIKMTDGSEFDSLDLARRVVEIWGRFLADHGL